LQRHQLQVDTLRAGAAQVNVQTHVPTMAAAPPPSQPAPQDDLLKRLETLKTMADRGLITADYFERRKGEILAQL
jgi:hypothetical protein